MELLFESSELLELYSLDFLITGSGSSFFLALRLGSGFFEGTSAGTYSETNLGVTAATLTI